MGYQMCKNCGKKMIKRKVKNPLNGGKLEYKTYCPRCNPIV